MGFARHIKEAWVTDCEFDESIGNPRYARADLHPTEESLSALHPELHDFETCVYPQRVYVIDADFMDEWVADMNKMLGKAGALSIKTT